MILRVRVVERPAADLVDVDYDMLPAVVDMTEAPASQTVLFPEAGTNVAASRRAHRWYAYSRNSQSVTYRSKRSISLRL